MSPEQLAGEDCRSAHRRLRHRRHRARDLDRPARHRGPGVPSHDRNRAAHAAHRGGGHRAPASSRQRHRPRAGARIAAARYASIADMRAELGAGDPRVPGHAALRHGSANRGPRRRRRLRSPATSAPSDGVTTTDAPTGPPADPAPVTDRRLRGAAILVTGGTGLIGPSPAARAG